MNTKEILQAFAYVILTTTLCLTLAYGCNPPKNSSDSKSSSTEFTSTQDVKDYCNGKVFKIPYLGVTTIGNDDNIVVKNFTAQTAIVNVLFDMSEILGRAVTSSHTFKINRQTGTYESIDEDD